jgi:predicted RNA-binding Zn ribbon-like protein
MDEEAGWNGGSFVGGALCLDFANTQGGRDKARDLERLVSYPAVVDWARAAGAISDSEEAILRAGAGIASDATERNLGQLRRLRECLYRVFSALADEREPAAEDDDALRRAIAAAVTAARLKRHAGTCDWSVEADRDGLRTLAHRIALNAQRLLLSSDMPFVKECERCSWLFVDRSKNKRRRWCKPETCGNRTRASRHYWLAKT